MIDAQCIESYSRLKHLKLVGEELGVPWQTVYVKLRNAGVKVTGDKARYGSVKDRLSSYSERLFSIDVPFATNSNDIQYQASIDFVVNGLSVDVKAAALRGHNDDAERWAFSINKQKDKADFFVLYAFNNADEKKVVHVFLIPKEIATTKSVISVPKTMQSKWADYQISREDLAEFFSSFTNAEFRGDEKRSFSASPGTPG